MITGEGYSKLMSTLDNPLPKVNHNDEFIVEGAEEMGIVVVDVNGVLMYGVSEEDEQEYGVCDVGRLYECLEELAEDSTVSEIVLSITSPGGETSYIPETGKLIKYINDNIKPVRVWIPKQCASAAYWLASQAGSIGTCESADIGSVGVYTLIEDSTKALEQAGIKIDAISSGKYKLIGHSFRSLTDEERDILQQDINKTHEQFKTVIQANRNIASEDLEGLSYDGNTALSKGFVDVLVNDLDNFLTIEQ